MKKVSSEGKRATFSQRLRGGGILIVPGVFDMLSAKMADQAGLPAIYMTGFGISASLLGYPDAGLATYTEMVGRVTQIAAGTTTPLIADGDTGFGGIQNLERTILGYEAAGAAAIQIEDQVFPKRCGHTPGREVIPAEDMVEKIRVASSTRNNRDFLIIARTDSRTSLGLDEALARGEAYTKAGADILFIESPENEREMEIIGSSFDTPLVANIVEGGRTPELGSSALEALGYKIALFPVTALMAAANVLDKLYSDFAEVNYNGPTQELYNFSEFNSLVGFDSIWQMDSHK